MATYVDILRTEFPEIDTEVFDYITGVLDSGGADFENGEEVFEAIGGVLQEVSADCKNEEDIRDICLQMFNTLQLNNGHPSQKQVLLDAPVQLSQISANSVSASNDVQGIWMLKRGQSTEASASQASSKKENRVDMSGKNRSYDVRIENFDVSFGERSLLQGAELVLASGRRYGLIGRNGLGKTTLLKMLASRSLRVPAHISILHVEQEVEGDDTTALQSVLQSDTVHGLESVRLSEIYVKLEEIEADKAPASLCDPGRAGLLSQNATADNQTWQSTILVVSHDRNFLNAVVTDIIHLHSQRLESYRGDYENFVKTKEDRLKNQQREYEAQLQYREHIQVFIDRFRYNANRAAQVQSKLKLLEKLPELRPIEKESEVGENGAGKTTMLKLLMGELTPVSGIRHAHRNLKIGYFSQHHVDQLDLNVCSVELLLNKFPGRPEEEYRHQLGRYGVTGELAMRPVASLSGGQKSRVAFAQMTMPSPNFYILDEPTNHLDMETIEALAKALNIFKGGVVLVSHDERLIRLVCKELWVCEGGKVRRVEGGFDEYRDVLQEQFRKEGYL
ncbi:hypothetical protein JZ751_014251 [Albula glossodonta]|uniref:ABC transporter domain-containing protein n=1 Tax=Albula glossodonta TaxID=121402 RepID=A0A8T2NVH6_9TELE|nr:hypothetical protein JZ751_014251 [Albula glossodonta]